MRKLIVSAAVAVFLIPFTTLAHSRFDGTWKIDIHKMQPGKPDAYLVKDGMFECMSCEPALEVKMDGQYHSVKDNPYFDKVATKALSDRRIELTAKRGEKVVLSNEFVVSVDGNSLSVVSTDATATNSAPVTAKVTYTRVGDHPAGSEPMSGSWQVAKVSDFSDNGLTFTLKLEGDTVHFSDPTGQSYTATLGGAEAPYDGDPGTTSVSVKRVGRNTIEETDKRNNKTIAVLDMAVSPDGRSMTYTVHDLLRGRVDKYVANKQ